MSAWFVTAGNIDRLVTAAQNLGVAWPGEPKTASEIGNALWRENAMSLNARYNDPLESFEKEIEAYAFNKVEDLDDWQALKPAHCYSYQSCEHKGWENSLAKKFVDEIDAKLMAKLGVTDETYGNHPGWKRADWA